MQLGLQLGYWGAQPPDNAGELVLAAEGAGFTSVFAAESWGSDAFSPLAWWDLRTGHAQPEHEAPTGEVIHRQGLHGATGG